MDPDTPPEDRRALRERLIAERMTMPQDLRDRAEASALAALTARFPPGEVGPVGAYWPIRGEVDCMPYLNAALAAGASVALPADLRPGRPLAFRAWTPLTRMAAGRFGIPHPAEGPEVIPTVLLIPLVGFDEAGHRLGYGGGYYDRTLVALHPRPVAIGLGFELGRLASLRPAAHDAPMDYIFTEAGMVHAPKGG